MTLNEISYNIKNLVEGGISGEDSNLSIRQINHMVHYHRANLLTKYTDSGRFTSDVMFETLTRSGSNLGNLPQFIGWSNNKAIRDVVLRKNNEQKNYHVSIISESNKDFFQQSKFTPNKSHFFCTISPGNTMRIYENDGQIFSDSTYVVDINAVFAEPTGNIYPIPAELVSSLIESVLAKEFNMYLRTSTDNINNSVDDKGAKGIATPVSASPNANARSRKKRTR